MFDNITFTKTRTTMPLTSRMVSEQTYKKPDYSGEENRENRIPSSSSPAESMRFDGLPSPTMPSRTCSTCRPSTSFITRKALSPGDRTSILISSSTPTTGKENWSTEKRPSF